MANVTGFHVSFPAPAVCARAAEAKARTKVNHKTVCRAMTRVIALLSEARIWLLSAASRPSLQVYDALRRAASRAGSPFRAAMPEVSAVGRHRTLLAERPARLADLFAVLFQEQIGALPRREFRRNFRLHVLLSRAVARRVVLLLAAEGDAQGHVRLRCGNRRHRRDSTEQQDAVRTRIADSGELLEHFARFSGRTSQGALEISPELPLYGGRDLFQSARALL